MHAFMHICNALRTEIEGEGRKGGGGGILEVCSCEVSLVWRGEKGA